MGNILAARPVAKRSQMSQIRAAAPGDDETQCFHVAADQAAAPPTAWRRIAGSLRIRIAAGEFGPTDRLPSETQLIAQYGRSRNTARHAIAQLVLERLTTVRHGVGAFPVTHAPICSVADQCRCSDHLEAPRSAEQKPEIHTCSPLCTGSNDQALRGHVGMGGDHPPRSPGSSLLKAPTNSFQRL